MLWSSRAARPSHRPRRAFRLESLETRVTPIIGPTFTPAPMGAAHWLGTGVVRVDNQPAGVFGTGTLLSSGRHILTAAHVVDDNGDGQPDPGTHRVTFELPGGGTAVMDVVHSQPAPHVFVMDGWNGGIGNGRDLAILELPRVAPGGLTRHNIYRGTDEVGRWFYVVGYGRSGHSSNTASIFADGQKRFGTNFFDAAVEPGTAPNDSILTWDIDQSMSAWADGGNAGPEVISAPGDSGGPLFLWGPTGLEIAAVHSFGQTNKSFGSMSSSTRVSVLAYQNWIDRTMARSLAAGPFTDYDGGGRSDIAFHRPGSTWSTVPMLVSNGTGGWGTANSAAPSWANQPGVVALPGDFNADGRSDIAFYRPGSTWSTVPILFSDGKGGWIAINPAAPSWANQPGVVGLTGDYNRDGRTDIAFYRPGSTWSTVPVLFYNGDGTWGSANMSAPSWANQPGVVGLTGDYNRDGLTDIAFHRPGSTWGTVPVLFANSNGSWASTNFAVPSWANQPGVVARTGDFNGDGRTDITFHRPGSTWNSMPVLFANGDGSWGSTNFIVPSWANQPGVVSLTGDFNLDGRTDVAFHRPGSTWGTVPVLFANGNGSWASTNFAVPSWANQPGVVAVTGDYNLDGRTDIAFHRPGSTWGTAPVLFANGNGGWGSTNFVAPSWANQPGVIAVKRRG